MVLQNHPILNFVCSNQKKKIIKISWKFGHLGLWTFFSVNFSVKPSKVFGFGSRKSKIYEPNKFVTENLDEDHSKQFQDQRYVLTNHVLVIVVLKSPNSCWKRQWKFICQWDCHARNRNDQWILVMADPNSEKRFFVLFVQCTEEIARKVSMGMFKKTVKSLISDWEVEI